MVMIFENLKKKLMHLQMLCGGLPTNKFGKGLANLDCFAWFSHIQALNSRHTGRLLQNSLNEDTPHFAIIY